MTEPVACTLTTADLGRQRERWTSLLGRAGTARIERDDGLRLEFADGGGVERELRELVAVETDCCRWAEWSVVREGGRLAMEARSTGDGVAALHAMFAGADRRQVDGRRPGRAQEWVLPEHKGRAKSH